MPPAGPAGGRPLDSSAPSNPELAKLRPGQRRRWLPSSALTPGVFPGSAGALPGPCALSACVPGPRRPAEASPPSSLPGGPRGVAPEWPPPARAVPQVVHVSSSEETTPSEPGEGQARSGASSGVSSGQSVCT